MNSTYLQPNTNEYSDKQKYLTHDKNKYMFCQVKLLDEFGANMFILANTKINTQQL